MTDTNPFDNLANFVICDESDQDKKEMMDHGIKTSRAIMEHLEKFTIGTDQAKCLLDCSCGGNYEQFKETIFAMTDRLTGYCNECDCNWGPSRTAERTQCFHPECEDIGDKFCTGCYVLRYCSTTCQHSSWKGPTGHKKRCAGNKNKILGLLASGTKDDDMEVVISIAGLKQFKMKYDIK